MVLRDPFAAYNAGSNVEAHIVCGLLLDAGITAMVIEDVSQAGVWLGGTVAEIHKPQVWIERADIERARPVLTDYDQRNAERRAAERGEREAGPPVEVVCEECGKRSEFPAAQTGTVQNCPHCRAYVDVGDEVEFKGWDEAPGDDEA
jgi:Putative prokaryotic signal transducing protein